MPFTIGENVGPYRIVEKLGRGGMATVFKAYHAALDRYVAIKVLHTALQEDPSFLARFKREARIVAKLEHPAIVPIYDYAEHRDHPYLVIRFVEGETLKARLQRGSLSLEEVHQVLEAVGSALSYAHGEGVLHRDIKPSNVILTPDGKIYLADFGLARMAEGGESTLTGDMMVGTPQYISPEQAKGDIQLDARTDVYSLGVVLYELLVGRTPFQADTPYAVVHDHIFTPLPLPSSIKPDLPEAFERILLKALAKNPNDRFQSVAELTAAFEEAVDDAAEFPLSETVAAPPPAMADPVETVAQAKKETEEGREEEKQIRTKRRRWPWLIGGAAALVVVGFLGLLGLGLAKQQQSNMLPGPEGAVQLLERARSAREQDNPVRALNLYGQAQEADPQLVPAYLEAADLLMKRGEYGRAAQLLTEGLEANPGNLAMHGMAAETALLMERWDEASQQVGWMLEEAPGDPSAHAYNALIALGQGSLCAEVRPELDTALRLDPQLAWGHYGLAICYTRERNWEAARRELEFVLDQEAIPHGLRTRAEQQLAMLEEGGRDQFIQREIRGLHLLAGEIPEEELRSTITEQLDQAQGALEGGDHEGAVQILRELLVWVDEHWDELGDRRADELITSLEHIIRVADEP
ncbi:MAG: protein kinase [Anaerolineae bacterium]|jgi:tetratricopeptide (TPR) repeat protein